MAGQPDPYDTVTAALEAATGHRPARGDWRCPAHDDSTPSLSVKRGDSGVVLKCHAGCTTEDVVAAAGLRMADLFPPDPDRPRIVDTYDYTDETGGLLFQVVRMEPKTFRQRKPAGDGWEWRLNGTRRVLYRLTKVVETANAGGTVFVVEGEKDVHALEAAGETATTNPGGAGKWRDEYSLHLAGGHVIVVADRDTTGRRHARQVAESARWMAASVVIAEPAVGKDVADHLAAGRTVDELDVVWDPVDPVEGQDDWWNAAAATVEEAAPDPDRPPGGLTPVDWAEFWNREHAEADWLVYPLVPRGRQIALWAIHKTGKSLITLEIAAALATGRPVLAQPAAPPIDVIYLDMEMTEDDLHERLSDLGYGPDDNLERLHYYLLPSLPPLDQAEGGKTLLELAQAHRAELIVLDTMSRVVAGDENDADTYRGFYRWTGLHLKALGCSVLRLDHGGKDPTRGQRGSSSKGDDVDVVWQLKPAEDGLTLKRDASRVAWVPETVSLARRTEPTLRHDVTAGAGFVAGTKELADELDRLGLPISVSVRAAGAALRGAGGTASSRVLRDAVRFRRERGVAAWTGAIA